MSSARPRPAAATRLPASRQPDGPEPGGQRVAGEARGGHGEAEAGERSSREGGTRVRAVVQEHRTPISRGTLGKEGAEGDQAKHDDGHRPAVRPGIVRRWRDRPAGQSGKQPRRRDHHRHGDKREVCRGAHAERGGANRDNRPGEQAHAPHPVEARHQRPRVGTLHHHPLGVHRDVHRRRDHAIHEQHACEHYQRPSQRRADEQGREHRDTETNHAPGTEPGCQESTQPAARQRTNRGTKQRQPERGIRQVERMLDRRHPARERPGDRRMHKERRADGQPTMRPVPAPVIV